MKEHNIKRKEGKKERKVWEGKKWIKPIYYLVQLLPEFQVYVTGSLLIRFCSLLTVFFFFFFFNV